MNKTVKFVLLLLGAAFVGGMLGFCAIWLGGNGANAETLAVLESGLALAVPAFQLLVMLACGLWAAAGMKRARRAAAALEGGDEEQAEAALKAADTAMNTLELQQMLVMFSLPFAMAGKGVALLASGVLVLVNTPLVILSQGRIVEFIRRISPEKRGDIRDLRFNKDWYNSCDEAERQKVGLASYRAVLATQMVLLVLLVVVVMARILAPGDNLAAWCLLAAILTLKVSYWLGCRSAERKGGGAL